MSHTECETVKLYLYLEENFTRESLSCAIIFLKDNRFLITNLELPVEIFTLYCVNFSSFVFVYLVNRCIPRVNKFVQTELVLYSIQASDF